MPEQVPLSALDLAPSPEPREPAKVEPARLDRTILTALFPGNASIRPTQAILQEAFAQERSVGYISALRLAAGRRAGEVLSGMAGFIC